MRLSKLGAVSVAAAHSALASASGSPPAASVPVSLATFQQAVRGIVPGGAQLSLLERKMLSRSLDGAFLVLDAVGRVGASRIQEGASSADALALLLLYCGGNKSEKLSAIFDAYANCGVNSCAGLSQAGLAHLLQTTLWCLFACRDPSTARAEAAAGDSTTVADVAAASRSYAAAVFESVSGLQATTTAVTPGRDASIDDSTITFDDFANYYSRGGFETLPWLELFSLHKFLGDTDRSVS